MVGLLFFFSALGAFNGILLSAYLFFANREKNLSKYLLGALVRFIYKLAYLLACL